MAIIGGLNDELDVKILVLYILNYAGGPLKRDNILNIGMESGTVEYFDLSQAMDDLLLTGHIDITSEDATDTFRLTEVGRQALGMFESTLPYTVRRKNQAAFVKMLADIERKQHVKSNIEKKQAGFEVTCSLLEGEDTLLEYKVFVPTLIQAQMIADQFETDPTTKYKSILQLLVDEKLFED